MENEVTIDQETPVREVKVENLSMRQMLELDACMRCGECSNWCPAYERTSGSPSTRAAGPMSSES
jgi:L-lactate utilization protein LutB